MFVYFLRGMLPRSHADPRLVLAQKTFTRGLPDINATHGTHVGEYNVNVEKASEQMRVFNEHRSLFSLDSGTVKRKPHFMTGYKRLMPDRKNVRAELLFQRFNHCLGNNPGAGSKLELSRCHNGRHYKSGGRCGLKMNHLTLTPSVA